MDEIDYSNEEWRPVVGWEGLYEVSSHGNVRRTAETQRLKGLPNLKPIVNRFGYLWVMLQNKDIQKKQIAFVHVFVAEAFIYPRPEGKFVNHKDGNKTHNHYENLEWLTQKENQEHAARTGLYQTGDRSPRRRRPECWENVDWLKNKTILLGEQIHNSLFTEQQVRDIRKMYAEGGIKQVELARMYGVTKGTIRHMIVGITWKHVV